MPEILTKYPDIAIQVLKQAGIKCGDAGAKPAILKNCPTDRLCHLPTGELCIYGVNELPKMSQIKREEILNQPAVINWTMSLMLLIIGVFLLGFVIGKFLK